MDGTELRIWRKGQGLTQEQLSMLLGVSRPTVNRWEAGTQSAPERMLGLACEQLGQIERKVKAYVDSKRGPKAKSEVERTEDDTREWLQNG